MSSVVSTKVTKMLGAITALAVSSAANVESKIGVMVAILLVSLFAVSFPTISKQTPFLRIPAILFFIGKHFGTGVILATAFIHLLDDAFRSLQNPKIKEHYGRIGKWTGLIILGSLLAIFLVEYISTTYVEHLRDKPSAPPTPTASLSSSPTSSPRSHSRVSRATGDRDESRSRSPTSSHRHRSRRALDNGQVGNRTRVLPPHVTGETGLQQAITESTPLLLTAGTQPLTNTSYTGSRPATVLLADPASTFNAPFERPQSSPSDQNGNTSVHERHAQPSARMPAKHLSTPNFHLGHTTHLGAHLHSHSHNHPHGHVHHPGLGHVHSQREQHHFPALLLPEVLPIEVLNNSPRICRLGLVDHHPHPRSHSPSHGNAEPQGHLSSRRHSAIVDEGDQHLLDDLEEDGDNVERLPDEEYGDEESHYQHDHRPKIGRRRQIVGILVLQLGIMIHSLVIGLTLAVTYGSDFASLTTAIIFHQLFEGLSLGIRIAALPPQHSKHHHHHHHAETHQDEEDTIYAIRDDEHNHDHASKSCSLGSTTATAAGTPASLDTIKKQITPPLVGGSCQPMSHGHASDSPSLWKRLRRRWRRTEIHWLKPTLSFLFAITTPFGMCVGMAFWGAKTKDGSPGNEAQMLLIQGLMSAISAGMLIYAATVEMIAGDFVFGDVEGHGGHHHHHHESHEGHEHEHESQSGHTGGSSVGKRALAVVSLLMGALGMVLVGLGE